MPLLASLACDAPLGPSSAERTHPCAVSRLDTDLFPKLPDEMDALVLLPALISFVDQLPGSAVKISYNTVFILPSLERVEGTYPVVEADSHPTH